MKRILSIFLTVAMLCSVLAVSAVAEINHADVTNGSKSVFSYATNKETYAPGDTVVITVSADSFWGDQTKTVEDADLGTVTGAYGPAIFTVSVVFDNTVFTAKKPVLATDSTIGNGEYMSATMPNATVMNRNGYGLVNVTSSQVNDDNGYITFYGSGEVCTYTFTISADAANGDYPIYIGDYGRGTATNYDVEIDGKYFKYSPAIDPYSHKIDRAYSDYGEPVIITVGEGSGDTDTETPDPVDPMSMNIEVDSTNAYVAGDTVTYNVSVSNNTGLTADDMMTVFSYDNTQLKLTGVTTPLEGFSVESINYEALNTIGAYEDLGKLTTVDCYIAGDGTYTEDGTFLTLTFEVLPYAESGSVTVSGNGDGADIALADAVITVAGDHTHAFEDVIVPATCTEIGTEDKTCSCGLSYRIATNAKLGHTPTTVAEDITTVAATCTDRGYTTTPCTVCGAPANVVYTDALGHKWTESDVEASCTQDGYHLKKCDTCGIEEKSNIVAALAHKNPDGSEAWGEPSITTKPTTNSLGYWGKYCGLCGGLYEYESIPLLEVEFGDCNMDGTINLNDVSVLMKYSARWENLYFSVENADVNHDARVNAVDASKLMKYCAGWDVDLNEGSQQIK